MTTTIVHDFVEIRRIKILEYAARQAKRTVAEKENDFQDINYDQQVWSERRIKKNSKSSWGAYVAQVWGPWNRYGEPINKWSELQ